MPEKAEPLTIYSIPGPTEASYLFADSTDAIYLSRFTDSRISFVNQIPAELLGKLDCRQTAYDHYAVSQTRM